MIEPQCTCGPYWSVIPPGPCPTHQPLLWMEYDIVRRYRAATQRTVTTTNTITFRSDVDPSEIADHIIEALKSYGTRGT